MKGLKELLVRRAMPSSYVGVFPSCCVLRPYSSSSSSRFSTSATEAASSELEKEYEKEIEDILRGYKYRAERRQALVGKVVSTKCMKTINVLVPHYKYIQKYEKHVKRHKKIMAHDADGMGELGDLVRIVPCRPMSKKKRHILKDVVRKARKLDLSQES